MTKDEAINILWNYNVFDQVIAPADVIIACGAEDDDIPKTTLELYEKGFAPLIVCSGKGSPKNFEQNPISEAERFGNFLIENSVPKEKIILEPDSTNMGDNITFSMRLLRGSEIFPKSVILVHKPYMERRAFATFLKQFPEINCIVTSSKKSFEGFTANENQGRIEHTINMLVADTERIMKYPAKGFITEQDIPLAVFEAFEVLKNAGYTKYLLKD